MRTAMATKLHKPVATVVRHAPHAEHYGFAAYASWEALGLGHSIYWIAVYLMVTGVLVEVGMWTHVADEGA